MLDNMSEMVNTIPISPSYACFWCDLLLTMIQVLNCHDSVIYILSPLKYATIYGCSDATIVVGAVGKVTLKIVVCASSLVVACMNFIMWSWNMGEMVQKG